MEPSLAVTTDIQILARNVLALLTEHRRHFIVATYVTWGFIGSLCHATTVVTIVDQNRILMGADSLWRGSKAGTALRCKIHTPKKNCVFAIIGLRTKRETQFDSVSFANRACELSGPLAAIATTFGDSVRQPLMRALEYSRLNDPIIYKREYQGNAPLEAVFAGFRGGKPFAAIKSFTLDTAGKLTDGPPIQIPDSAGNNIALSGEHDAAKLFLSKNPTWAVTTRYPELIRALVQSEIGAKPNKVNGPISILEITRTKQTWIDYGKCSTQIGTGRAPLSLAAGDFNGDGVPDLAVANY